MRKDEQKNFILIKKKRFCVSQRLANKIKNKTVSLTFATKNKIFSELFCFNVKDHNNFHVGKIFPPNRVMPEILSLVTFLI